MVYKRGKFYSYKFRFDGQVIRASAKTTSKTVAREAERARRRELELAVNPVSRSASDCRSLALLQKPGWNPRQR